MAICAAILQLLAIGVALPLNAPKKMAIVMIGAKDNLLFLQAREGGCNVIDFEMRTIPTNHHDLIVTERGHLLDGSLQTLGERGTDLAMHFNARSTRRVRRGEEMNICVELSGPDRSDLKQRSEHFRKAAPRQIEPGRVGENEESFSFHGIMKRLFAVYSRVDALLFLRLVVTAEICTMRVQEYCNEQIQAILFCRLGIVRFEKCS